MLVLLGSEAINYHHFFRNPKDLDVLGSYDEIRSFGENNNNSEKFGKLKSIYPIANGKKMALRFEKINVEAEITWENSHSEDLYNLIKNDKKTKEVDGMLIPSMNILYLLKMSHRYLKNSPHFLKTMDDIIKMRELGAIIEPEHMEFFKKREKATYNYGHPKLNKDKESFFTDDVDYRYDHDTIHLSMKHLDKPAYMYFKPEDEEVWCSKEMWDKCDEKIKLNAVLEETQVLALERSQVLFSNVEPKRSFDMALSKVCTSITSGWFREYAWENYYKVQKMYENDYVERFWKDVENGLVQPLKGKRKLSY